MVEGFYNFDDLFAFKQLSDVTIVLSTATEDAGGAQPPAKRARTAKQYSPRGDGTPAAAGDDELLPGHSVILAGCSRVFKAQLTRWKEQPPEDGKDKPHVTLRANSPAELEAARMLVQFMYQRRLPEAATQQQLILMLLLADKYDVQTCALACAKALSQAQLEPDILTQVLQLPPAQANSAEFRDLFSTASDQLQREFGDLEQAWADDVKRQRFIALPIKGVELLLGDQCTRVASENTALLAATAWAEERGGWRTEVNERLAVLIRVPYLSPFYAAGVAMLLPWFVDALGVATMAAGLGMGRVIAGHCEVHQAILTDSADSFGWPASWPLGVRSQSARQELSMQWTVALEGMKDVLSGEISLKSPVASFAGFEWCLSIDKEQSNPEEGQAAGGTLRLSLCAGLSEWIDIPEVAKVPVALTTGTVTSLGKGTGQPIAQDYSIAWEAVLEANCQA